MSSCSRYCFAPGCKTGYPSTRKKKQSERNTSLFKAPEDDALLEKWRRAVPRADKQLQSTHSVCALHFCEEDIDRYFEVKLADGSVWKTKRGVPRLKKDAVPSIFPNLPSSTNTNLPSSTNTNLPSSTNTNLPSSTNTNLPSSTNTNLPSSTNTNLPSSINTNLPSLSNITQKRKPPANRSHVVEKTKCSKSVTITPRTFTFEELISDVDKIIKPNNWWTVSLLPHFLIFVKWNSDYAAEKRVVIDKNLNVKVFLKSKTIATDDVKIIKSVNDASSLISDVDNYIICFGVDNGASDDCLVYVESKKKTYAQNRWCKNCFTLRKNKADHERMMRRRREKTIAVEVERKNFRLLAYNVTRKNNRLKRKVMLLKKKITLTRKRRSTVTKETLKQIINDLPDPQTAFAKIPFEEIVGELPEKILTVSYGSGIAVSKGSQLTKPETSNAPSITFDADTSQYYSLVMIDVHSLDEASVTPCSKYENVNVRSPCFAVANAYLGFSSQEIPDVIWDPASPIHLEDPDAPTPENPRVSQFLHWLVINIPGADMSRGGDVIESYFPPSPPETSKSHGYIFLLYNQGNSRIEYSFPDCTNFKVKTFADQSKLGDPVAWNYFSLCARTN